MQLDASPSETPEAALRIHRRIVDLEHRQQLRDPQQLAVPARDVREHHAAATALVDR